MTTSWGITLLWSLLKGEKMQVFIASGRVAFIPNDAVDRTKNGHTSFKFEFVCDSSMTDDTNKPIPSFFHVQVYGKQAELMAQSLSKGSPILLKGEIIQRPYNDEQDQRRTYQFISPNQQGGITFLENREASNRRKQEQQGFSQPIPSSIPTPYPEPTDADSPF